MLIPNFCSQQKVLLLGCYVLAFGAFSDVSAVFATTRCEKSSENISYYIKEENCPDQYFPHSKEVTISSKTISVDFFDINIQNIFRLISKEGGLNIFVDGDVNNSVTISAMDISLNALISQLIEQYDLVVKVSDNTITVESKETSSLYADAVKQKPNTQVVKKRTNWDEVWEVAFEDVSLEYFIQEVNKRTDSNIIVEDNVKKLSVSLNGSAVTKTILQKAISALELSLERKDGRYVLGKESIAPVSTVKQKDGTLIPLNQSCDIYLRNGGRHLSYVIEKEHDGTLNLRNSRISINIPADSIAKVINCRDVSSSVSAKSSSGSRQNEQQDQLGRFNKHPRGTVVMNPFYGDTSTVWQLYSSYRSNEISGYHGYIEGKSRRILGGDEDDDITASIDSNTGYITAKHYYYKYPAIRAGFTKHEDIFKIQGSKVLNEHGEIIGSFKPGRYLLNQNFHRN